MVLSIAEESGQLFDDITMLAFRYNGKKDN